MSRTQEQLNNSLAAAQNNIKDYAAQAYRELELLISNSATQLNQLESAEDKTQYAQLVTGYADLVRATRSFQSNLTPAEQVKAAAKIQSQIDDLFKLKSEAVRSGLTNKLNFDTARNISQLNQIQDRNGIKRATKAIKNDIKEGANLANKKVKTNTAEGKGTGKKDSSKKANAPKEAEVQVEKWGVKFSFSAPPSYPAKDDYYKKDESYYLTLLPAMNSAFSAQGNTDVPNSSPGLNFKLIPNLAKHKIPGFQPAYQHLGIDGCICTMVGCFTGADGYSLLEDETGKGKTSKQALGDSTLFDSYGVAGLDTQEGLKRISQQLDSYKNFQQFYQFAIRQGRELTVEINLAKNGALPIGTGDDETLRAGNGNPKFKALVKNLEVYHARSDRTWYTIQLELTDFGLASKTPINLTNQLSDKVKEYQEKLKNSGASVPGSFSNINPDAQANKRLVDLMQTPDSRHRIYQLGDDEVLYQVLSNGVNHYFIAKDESIREITGDQDAINKALDRRSAGDKISADDTGRAIMGALGCAGGVVLGALITGATAGVGALSLVGAGALCASVGIGTSFTPWGREEDISDFTTKDGLTEFTVTGGSGALGGVVIGKGAPLLKGAAGSVSRQTGRVLSRVPGSGTVSNLAGNISNSSAAQATRNLSSRIANSRAAQAANQLAGKAQATYDRLNVPLTSGRSPEYLRNVGSILDEARASRLKAFGSGGKASSTNPLPVPSGGNQSTALVPVPDDNWAVATVDDLVETLPDNRLLGPGKAPAIPESRIEIPPGGTNQFNYAPRSSAIIRDTYDNIPTGSKITNIAKRRPGESLHEVTVRLPSGEDRIVQVNKEQLTHLINGTNKPTVELPIPRASTPSETVEVVERNGSLVELESLLETTGVLEEFAKKQEFRRNYDFGSKIGEILSPNFTEDSN